LARPLFGVAGELGRNPRCRSRLPEGNKKHSDEGHGRR
jgi:hypothetical protein